MFLFCFFEGNGDPLDLPVLTHSFPTRRSSDLTGIGDNVGIISFEIEREQGGAVELPAGRGNSRAVAYLDRLGNRDTDTRLAARYLWQPVGLLLLVASFAQGDRCENLTGEKQIGRAHV